MISWNNWHLHRTTFGLGRGSVAGDHVWGSLPPLPPRSIRALVLNNNHNNKDTAAPERPLFGSIPIGSSKKGRIRGRNPTRSQSACAWWSSEPLGDGVSMSLSEFAKCDFLITKTIFLCDLSYNSYLWLSRAKYPDSFYNLHLTVQLQDRVKCNISSLSRNDTIRRQRADLGQGIKGHRTLWFGRRKYFVREIPQSVQKSSSRETKSNRFLMK